MNDNKLPIGGDSPHILLSGIEASTSISMAKQGREQLREESPLASAEEIKEDTQDPPAAKGEVDNFYDPRIFPSHPEESKVTRLLHPKPGKILSPLITTFGKAAKVFGVANIGWGLLLGLPGIHHVILGARSFRLGEVVRERQQMTMIQKKKMEEVLSKLTSPDPVDSKKLKSIGDDLQAWSKGKGTKTFNRIRFEVLEAVITYDKKLDYGARKALLDPFTGKPVGRREYKELLKKYVNTKDDEFDRIAILKDMGLSKQIKIIENKEEGPMTKWDKLNKAFDIIDEEDDIEREQQTVQVALLEKIEEDK